MSARLLILCPGQGGQHDAMFDMARSDARAAALLARCMADGALPSGDAGAGLYANRRAQPLIAAAGLAMWEALRADLPRPALVAGYSIGELTAYGVAGALAPEQTVALAAERAALMERCVRDDAGQAMVSVSGLLPAQRAPLLEACGYYAAIVTGADSCVAGGPQAQAAALVAAVEQAGGRSGVLPVSIASHTPYMADAVAPFAAALRGSALQAPQAPVLSGIGAARVHTRDEAIDQLSRQLAEPIVWDACLDACAEAGITVALELGPGAALSRMLQARHPAIACRSAADFRSLDGVRAWLDRELG